MVQFLYMKKIIENLAFDQIYHEHLLYYNLKNIDTLLRRHGLVLFDAHLEPIHGGSMIGFVGHEGSREPGAAAARAIKGRAGIPLERDQHVPRFCQTG